MYAVKTSYKYRPGYYYYYYHHHHRRRRRRRHSKS